MLCNHCGSPLPEKASFCPECGQSPTGAEPKATKDSTAAPTESTPSDDRPFATPDFDSEGKGSLGGKGKMPKWLFFAMPLGLILILGLLLFPLFRGDLIKAFKSDGEYLAFVEEKALEEKSGDVTSVYSALICGMESGIGGDAEISLNASDEALGLLSSFVGEDYDLSFLNDLTLKTSVGGGKGVGAITLDLYLKKNGVFSLEAIADQSNGKIYLSLPDLNEKALMLNAEELKKAPVSPIPARALAVSLPEKDALTPMLKDYLKIALDEIENVTSHKESVTVGETVRDVTVLEYTLDREAVCRLIRAELTEWKKDERAAKILEKLAEEMTALGLADSPEAFLEEYEKGLDALLEEPDKLLEGLLEDKKLRVEVLVSSSHEILGRRFSVGDDSLSCITFREGEGFETELFLKGEKEITLVGKGTEKDGAVTGEFSVAVGETDLGKLALDGLAISEETGRLSGSVTLYPAKSVMKTLLGDAGGVLTALNTGLEIRFGEKDGKKAVDLFLTTGSLHLLEVNVILTEAEEREIAIPEEGEYRNGASKMDLALWGLGLDLNGLYSDLEKAGAEEGTVELIRTLVNRIKDSLF